MSVKSLKRISCSQYRNYSFCNVHFTFFPASKNQDENMYTTILASKKQEDLAEEICRLLERQRDVTVEERGRVISNSKDKQGCSSKLLDYIKSQKATGIVILSSEELCKLIKGQENVPLQITGEDVDFDSRILSEAFQKDTDVKKKILIVVPNGSVDHLSSLLRGVDVVSLDTNEDSWSKVIVAKFRKKNELRS